MSQEAVRCFLKRCLRILVTLFCMVGMGYTYDLAVGDGPLPRFRGLSPETKGILSLLDRNSTVNLENQKLSPKDSWQALAPTRRILQVVSPEIGQWLLQRYQKGLLVFNMETPVDHPQYIANYAYQSPVTGHFMLTRYFWQLSEMDKAGAIVHEYRHSRQNFPKIMADRTTLVLSGKVFWNPDGSRLEDEAYLYQEQYYRALGRHSSLVETQLSLRGYFNFFH